MFLPSFDLSPQSSCNTFADTVGVSKHSAFFDCSERVEQSPDIVLVVFLGHHSDKQLALISVLCVGRFHLNRMVHLEKQQKA